jgi:phage terminase Nu1 subunit (DNA packaging protein)
MPRAGHGKYDRLQCALWHLEKVKRDLADLEADKNPGGLLYQKTRETKAWADIKEMEAAKLRGELIPLDVYRQHVSMDYMVIRQNFLSMPARIAPQLEALSRPEIKALLYKRVCEIPQQLSTGKDLEKKRRRSPR